MKKFSVMTLVLILVVSMFGLTACFNFGTWEDVPDIVVPNEGINHSPQENQEEIKIGTGTYVGQIDGNSVEIIISGVPEDMATRAFRLSEELREVFDQIGIPDNSSVKFEYYIDSQEQWVLVNMDTM